MKRHKYKIIAAVVVLAVLTGAWFWGGNYNRGQGVGQVGQGDGSVVPNDEPLAASAPDSNSPPGRGGREADGVVSRPQATKEPEQGDGSVVPNDVGQAANEQITTSDEQLAGESPDSNSPLGRGGREADGVVSSPQTTMEQEQGDGSVVPPDAAAELTETDAKQGDGSVVPPDAAAELTETDAPDGSFSVTLSVACSTILDNMNLLNKEKHELVPPDGVIYPLTEVIAYEGESVFNVLLREMRRARIHMEFRNTPIYNSVYLLAINNIYEFDVGELSGWMYKVNGLFPSFGSSGYLLSPGDVVEFVYSCDLGADVGGSYAAGTQT